MHFTYSMCIEAPILALVRIEATMAIEITYSAIFGSARVCTRRWRPAASALEPPSRQDHELYAVRLPRPAPPVILKRGTS